MKERPETRLTVVFGGKRIFEKYNCTILEDIQDDGRTLKLFVGCSHNQRKKDEKVTSRIAHLETQSVQEEDNTQVKCKTKDVDNLVDIDNLSRKAIDGCRTPQDYSGQVSGTAKEDTGVVPFPADLKSKSDVEDSNCVN